MAIFHILMDFTPSGAFCFLEEYLRCNMVQSGDPVQESNRIWRKALAGLRPQVLTIPYNEESTGAGKGVFQLLVEALTFNITTRWWIVEIDTRNILSQYL